MKKHSIIGLIITLLSITGFAQTEEHLEKKYTITGGAFLKIDSLSDKQISLWPEVYVCYESNMRRHLSGFFQLNVIVPVSVDISFDKNFDDDIASHSAKGFGLNLGARYYINESLKGFYAGPIVSYYRYNHKYRSSITSRKEDEYSITSIRGSFVIGYQKVWESGFTLNIYSGAYLDHKNIKKFTSPTKTKDIGNVNLIKPDFSISVGYYF